MFLLYTVGYSLTGVMAPGAITAATLAHGSRHRWAGAMIAVGHGLVEIPLIFLLLFGLGTLLQSSAAKIAIGLCGGVFLVWLSVQTAADIARPSFDVKADSGKMAGPVMTGFLLSATNPYFLLWWAAGGLILAQQARTFGALALVLFAVVHWLLDLIWLTILSQGAFHGAALLGANSRKYMTAFCAAALLCFGVVFTARALQLLMTTVGGA